MATKQNGSEAVGVIVKENEIMEVDMTAKPMDDEDVDTIIEEGDADLIEMDDGEDGMEKYIEEDLEDGNYDDLVVEDDGDSLSNGATVSTTTKDVVVEEDEVLEEEILGKALPAEISTNTTVVTTPLPSNGIAPKAATPAATSTTQATKTSAVGESNGYAGNKDQPRKPPKPEDDDRPVSIPSDSDGEEVPERQPRKQRPLRTAAVAVAQSKQNGTGENDEVHEILSDKEDCVMLDDDTPPKVDSSSGSRKSAARSNRRDDYDDDIQEILDDPVPINSTTTIQPVSKKMRMSGNTLPSGTSLLSQNHLAGLPADLSITAGTTTITKDGGKFTFVDPKSLMNSASKQQQQQLGSDMTNLLAGGGLTISQVTPGSGGTGTTVPHGSSMRATITAVNNNSSSGSVNLSSGSGSNNSSSNSNKAAASAGVVSSTSSNAQSANAMTGGLGNILLPALTDDMFVLEAPSFIVPYIYEKPPSEDLRQIVDEMKRELDALKVKEDKPVVSLVDDDDDDESGAQKGGKEKAPGEGEKKEGEDEDSAKDKKRDKKGRGRKNADDSWGESDESTDDDASDTETRTKVLIKDVDTKNIESMLLPSGEKKTVDGRPAAGSDNYFESPLGQFFMSIGMSMVQEHVQGDLLRMQKRKQQREGGKPNIHLQTAINNLMNNLEASRKDNATFKFPAKRCDFCSFKSESGLAMANHYEKPHLKGNMYKCNFCEFEARPAHDILYHMEAVHNMKSKLEKPLSYHQCPNCPFEDNGKSKLARHTLACTKKFMPENNLLPAQDWDPPAKIPRVKPRHGLVGTATAYQAMAAQQQRIQAATGMLNRINNVPGGGLGGNMQNQSNAQMTANAALNLLTANAALLNNNVAMNLSGVAGAAGGGGGGKFRNKGGNQMGGKSRQSNSNQNAARSAQQQQQMANALMLQNNFNQLAAVAAAAKNFNSSQLLQMASQAGMLPNAHSSLTIQQSNPAANKSSKNVQQPSISITPLPRQNSAHSGSGSGSGGSGMGAGGSSSGGMGNSSGRGAPVDGSIPANLPKPGQHPSGAKSSFVICEICDGYIKDLDQLRSHMQMIHKVKVSGGRSDRRITSAFVLTEMFYSLLQIHPKMIYNRPPLNCQKCQYRFFTDQGLERHLLGSHGLVTSSMQEAANCGQDSGRCPICGRVSERTGSLNDRSLIRMFPPITGLPVEVTESRVAGPQHDSEASPSVVQMHRLYSHFRNVQAV